MVKGKSTVKSPSAHRHNPDEERANILTHGAGLVLSVVGQVLLMIRAFESGQAVFVLCFAVYGASLILLYASSFAYHLNYRKPWVDKLRLLDHAAIYVLIAGSYTPFSLIVLPGAWKWFIFFTIWTLAFAGVLFKLFSTGRYSRASTFLYVGMGWLAIIAINPLVKHLPEGALFWVVAGGLSYTGGVVFYLWEKLRYNHAIWHIFVMGGSAAHFWCVYRYLSVMQAV